MRSQHGQRKASCHDGVERQISFHSHSDPLPICSKYPPVSSRRDRSRYAAVFQDQYGEFSELQREVGATQAKLRQLEALLMSLPPPRSQVSPGASSVPSSLRLCFIYRVGTAIKAMSALYHPSEPLLHLALSEGGSCGSSSPERV